MKYGDTEQQRLMRCCCCNQPIEEDEKAELTADRELKHRRCQGEQSYLSDHTSGAAGAVRGP